MRKHMVALSALFCVLGVSSAMADDPADDLQGAATPLFAPNQWDESATVIYYNNVLRLAWNQAMGDHAPTELGRASLPPKFRGTSLSIPVTGNDFFIVCGPGSATDFASRNDPDPAKQPVLVVNGQQRYVATRDTSLDPSTSSPLGNNPVMKCKHTLLIAFDGYKPAVGDHATLVLTIDVSRGAQTFDIFRPAITFTGVSIPSTPATRIVADIRAKDFTIRANLTKTATVVTGAIEGAQRTAISQLFKLPAADEYYLTVVMKLDANWPDWGGKLPGLTDTGQASNTGDTPLRINGVNCSNSAWGGRSAIGCRWSARTGWLHRQGDQIGIGTYFYALNTGTFWGKSNPIPSPVTAGKWFAYVQRVKLNTIGSSDGLLSYWWCNESGCTAMYHQNNIQWRNVDLPQSKITEAWADVYCGGLNCGPGQLARSTTSLERMTVTDGLPDFAPIAAELRGLNGS